MRSRPRQRPDLAGAAEKQTERTRAAPLSGLPSQGLRGMQSSSLPPDDTLTSCPPDRDEVGNMHGKTRAPGKVSRSEPCGNLGRGDAPDPGANPEEPRLAAP